MKMKGVAPGPSRNHPLKLVESQGVGKVGLGGCLGE